MERINRLPGYNCIVSYGLGRFGNKMYHLIFSLALCFKFNINSIKLYKKILFIDKLNIKVEEHGEEYTETKPYCIKPFWYYNSHFVGELIEQNKCKILNFIKKNFILPEINKISNNILHIHIRSGDIFWTTKVDESMLQPPLIFYENEITRKKWDKVIIVSEDTRNPCIEYLTKKYDNVVYFGENSFEHDVTELLSARNIMFGNGSLIPLLSLLMPNIEKLYYWDQLQDRYKYLISVFHPGKFIVDSGYHNYKNEIKRGGGWGMKSNIKGIILYFKK